MKSSSSTSTRQSRNDINVVSECTLLISEKGEILSANTLAVDFFEAKHLDDIRLRNIDQFIHPEDKDHLIPLLLQLSLNNAASATIRLVSLKNKQFNVRIILTPNLLNNTNEGPFHCVFRNIEHEVKLSEELQLSNLRHAESQARAKLGSWERNLATQKAIWSKEMYRLFGLDSNNEPPDFKTVANMIHPEDRQEFIDLHDKAIKEELNYSMDARLVRKDGDIIWIEARSEIMTLDDGITRIVRGTAQDITARKLVEAKLKVREENLATFQTRAKISNWQYDIRSDILTGSDEFFRLIEQDPMQQQVDKALFLENVHPDDVSKTQAHIERIRTHVGKHGNTIRLVLKNGSIRWIQGFEETFADEQGRPYLVIGTMQDVSERIEAENKLQSMRDLLETSQAIAKLGGWEVDLNTKMFVFTQEIYHILETTPEKYAPTFYEGLERYTPESQKRIKNHFVNALELGENFDDEFQVYTFKGNIIDVRVTCNVISENNKPSKLTGILQNISEQKRSQRLLENANIQLEDKNKSLERIANYDALTHLPNRVLLSDRLHQATIQSQRHEKSFAVAFLDLDGFKTINDKYGHSFGDELLVKLAGRLKSSLRECDTLARIGGDEFVVILTDLTTPNSFEPMVHRLLEAASRPVILHGHELQVSASIGVTLYPDDKANAEQLLRHADQAMYLAKQAGKNQFHLFDVHNDTQVKSYHEELDRIRSAFYSHELMLFYQPKVNLNTFEIIGVEALLRWQHPSRGVVSPLDFLPIVQDNIFSIILGEWVIDSALSQLELWSLQGITTNMSVNVGATQLQRKDFVPKLKAILARHTDVNPNQLELEILEVSAINDIAETTNIIKSCQALGVTFALDDFGTGYSSLSYLKQLPADLIKIDQSFVSGMLENKEDHSIVEGVIGLSETFKKHVIAEGVETEAHCEELRSIGCELAQGFGISKPMPAHEFPEWCRKWNQSHAATIKEL